MSFSLISNVGRIGNGTTGAINTTGATLLVAHIADWDGFGATTGVTDSNGNSWTQAYEDHAATPAVGIFYCVPTSVGSGHTFSSVAAHSGLSFEISAWSGAHATPLDQTAFSRIDGTSGGAHAGSLTPSVDNCLVIACVGIVDSGTPTITAIDGGFTITDSFPSGSNMGSGMAYLVQTTAAAANPGWTFDTLFKNTASINVSFKPVAGGGGGTTLLISVAD